MERSSPRCSVKRETWISRWSLMRYWCKVFYSSFHFKLILFLIWIILICLLIIVAFYVFSDCKLLELIKTNVLIFFFCEARRSLDLLTESNGTRSGRTGSGLLWDTWSNTRFERSGCRRLYPRTTAVISCSQSTPLDPSEPGGLLKGQDAGIIGVGGWGGGIASNPPLHSLSSHQRLPARNLRQLLPRAKPSLDETDLKGPTRSCCSVGLQRPHRFWSWTGASPGSSSSTIKSAVLPPTWNEVQEKNGRNKNSLINS